MTAPASGDTYDFGASMTVAWSSFGLLADNLVLHVCSNVSNPVSCALNPSCSRMSTAPVDDGSQIYIVAVTGTNFTLGAYNYLCVAAEDRPRTFTYTSEFFVNTVRKKCVEPCTLKA